MLFKGAPVGLVSLVLAASLFGGAVAACGQVKDTASSGDAEQQPADLVVTGVSDDCSPALFTGSVEGISVVLGDGGANVPIFDLPAGSNGSARQDVHYDGTVSADLSPPKTCPASVRHLDIGAVTHTTTTLAFAITDTFHDLATCDGGADMGDLIVTPRNDCISKRIFTFTFPSQVDAGEK